MSTIYMPDPHPGRCRNLRRVGDETLRCLDYEGTEHVCSFPEPKPPIEAGSWGNSTFVQTEPKPWVKP